MNAQRSGIDNAVRAFNGVPLREAGLGLLDALGYRSAKTIELDGSPATFAQEVDHEGKLASKPACFDKWQEVQFLFQLTNDEIPMLAHGQQAFDLQEKYGRSIVDSFVFLAIALEGEDWKRGALAGITRAVNAMFAMPVIILFKHGALFSLAASERRPNRRDSSRDVQTGRISIILGVSTERPHRGHLSILSKLDWRAMRSRPSNFEELYNGWRAALSTKTLNEAFYKELSHWFFWARAQVTFPEGAGEKTEVPLIRLLTRVIFCWFIKERGLIPETLFRLDDVRPLLKDDPGQALDKGNYYRAILQNLFFATLNTEMDAAGAKPVAQASATRSRKAPGTVLPNGRPAESSTRMPQASRRIATRRASSRSGVTRAAVRRGVSAASRRISATASASSSAVAASIRLTPSSALATSALSAVAA